MSKGKENRLQVGREGEEQVYVGVEKQIWVDYVYKGYSNNFF